MESQTVRLCVDGYCRLSDYILSTLYTVGARSVFAACFHGTGFCVIITVCIVSGEAASWGLWVSVTCQFLW